MAKRGFISPQDPRSWCGVDATWHARPHDSATQAHASACMARRWRGCVAGPRESTRTPRWHHVAESQAGRWWDHGLVGPGKSIGAVMRRRYTTLPYIPTCPTNFLLVGLCSLLSFKFQATWHRVAHGCDRDGWDVSIAWTRVHQIAIKARAQFPTVDHVSEIRRSILNHV